MHPCSTAEIAAWCFGNPAGTAIVKIAISGRRVDGTGIREKLGIELDLPFMEKRHPGQLLRKKA